MAFIEHGVCDACEAVDTAERGSASALQGWGTVTVDYHGNSVRCMRTRSLYCPTCLKIQTYPTGIIAIGSPVLLTVTKTPGKVIAIELDATYVVMTYNGFESRSPASDFEIMDSEEEARRIAGFEELP